ncbi:tetratricopeptide repeat protein (plasmid) [Streptomyces cynarae]|uniref:Tetratricopeptide repeat protein n=1 Tax=Streptomyces cynarae TaxID=2981134 RepID=A0ABY6EDT3_9ACTN|nr:BTAD domain-containing putative transcriptional regulator [Streptomyces cynarae]UXY24905.1 tetratricopeptide repeat protein [Streptomyces cynarae]
MNAEMKPRRPRLLLAALVCRAGEIVSIEDIIDVVWGEDPPVTVRSQVQICVSAARRLLADVGMGDALKTHPFGYSLVLEPGQRDVDDFSRLVSEARAACDAGHFEGAVRSYRSALSLWRGPALSGLDSDVLRRKAVALNEERLTVLEDCIDVELLRGRERNLLSELTSHVSENPLREKLRGQLMLALHRAGRRTDALQVYREGRGRMLEDLGLEPSAELQRLEKEILNDAPELIPAYTQARGPAVPRQLPPRSGHFVGRDDIVEKLGAVLVGKPESGHPGTRSVNVYGQGGVGKTSLAVHVAHQVVQEHFTDGQLYYDLHGSEPSSVAAARVLDHFLRTLGVLPSNIPEGVDERAAMFRSCVADREMLVVLDDAADEAQIRPLLPGGHNCAVLITSRRSQPGIPTLQDVRLDVLSGPQAVELLRRFIGDKRIQAEPDAVAEVVRIADGLPLALSIVGTRLAAAPHRTVSFIAHRMYDDRRRLDELVHGNQAVRTTIASTYDALHPPLRRLLSKLSLFDMETIPGWMAGAVTGLGTEEAHDLMDEAAACQLLTPVEAEPTDHPRYRIHNLIRLFLKETASQLTQAERRDAVRHVTGAWLALVDEAHRQLYGGDFTLVRGQSPRWEPPRDVVGQVVTDPLGWMDGERSGLLAAIAVAGEYGFDEACWDLAVALVTLFEVRRYHDDWKDTHETALNLVLRTGNVRGEAATRCSLGSLYLSQRNVEKALPYLEKARSLFEELCDVGGMALSARNIALTWHIQGSLDKALREYEHAADLFLEVGDPVGRAHVWCNTAQIHVSRGDLAMAEQQLTAALRTCQDVGNPRVTCQVLFRLGELQLVRGHAERSLGYFRKALAIVRTQADQEGEGYVQRGLGRAHLVLGNLAEAARCFQSALSVADTTGSLQDAALAKGGLAEVYLAQGQHQRARALLEQALRVISGSGDTETSARFSALLARVS